MVDVTELGYSSFWESLEFGEGTSGASTGSGGRPYTMPGGSAGAVPQQYSDGAKAVYPRYDGITSTLPVEMRPASWQSDTSADGYAPDDFGSWHSAYQAEYIATQSTNSVTIALGGETVAYYVLTDDNRPINLMSMALAEFSALSAYDQSRFASDLAALGRLAELGLTSDLTAVQARINEVIDTISSSSVSMPTEDKDVFLGQIRLIVEAMGGTYNGSGDVTLGTGVIAEDTVLSALSSIADRFVRANTFFETEDPTRTLMYMRVIANVDGFGDSFSSEGSSDLVINSSSSDFGATILRGYEEYMRAERAILTSETRRNAISNSGFVDTTVDVPSLIMRFQLLYEVGSEAIADASTEEIRQLHKLLQDYAVMQQLVNTQLSLYDPGKVDERRRFMDVGSYTKTDGTTHIDTRQVIDDIDLHAGVGHGSTFQLYEAADDGSFGEYVVLYGEDPGGYSGTDKTRIAAETNVPKYSIALLFDGTSPIKTYVDGLPKDNAAYTPKWDGVEFDQEQMSVLSMFIEPGMLSSADNSHPLEKLYGVDRPAIDILDWTKNTGDGSLALMTKSEWESFSTSLSEAVTILNQNSQIKQNDIDTSTKQKNRHFELGNNALEKMNDILMSIGQI
ncbi:hypothetical protein [Phaeobacter sp. HF9A]|uniref:hypothetical protein n=1 Tax=Phaeobacter sp. HF9A TaxID=2721561 RepID=UPI0014303E83|nr:hypothetical protein [Phaeobacter sp. HF9A]NIZ11994.1 hypothetical protein [Phaeobacter sp. HF9A]